MVRRAQDYPWSSLHLRLNESPVENWLDESPGFNELGTTPTERLARYASFMEQEIPSSELQLLRGALQRGQLTGDARFTDEIEVITGLRITQRMRGRPAK